MTKHDEAAAGEPVAGADTTRARASRAQRTAEAEPAPRKIKITHRYGFVDENKRTLMWRAGDVITDAGEIEMLTERKAPFEKLE